jgi:hypothetical protein
MDPRKLHTTTAVTAAPFALPQQMFTQFGAAAPQALAFYKAGFDSWLALVNAALSGAERIRMAQLATDVETLGETHRAAVQAAGTKEWAGLMTVQADLGRAYLGGWMRYWSAVGEAMQSTQAEVGRILSARAAALGTQPSAEAATTTERKAA